MTSTLPAILAELKAILERVTGRSGLAAALADGASIVDEVGLDSLEMMNFLLEIERRLDIEIDFEKLDFADLHSLEKLAGFLASARRRSGPPS